ncbi:DUF6531 domain-containing protein [Chania multitudinisentens]|uniref:DUF6531 domain-containing protein n=1 Tax=Chania multitudinisentens TaxID=1639108 RepID=UPI0003E13FCF|nr:DUF6531 domain-containing protein [Chania multitudinisentens]
MSHRILPLSLTASAALLALASPAASACSIWFTSPAPGTVVTTPTVTLTGSASGFANPSDIGNAVATVNGNVFFNQTGQFTALINFLGSGAATATLQPGVNFLNVSGSVSGCSASDSMVLFYQPPLNEPDPSKNSGPPDTCAGNPLNVAVGNKYQRETDLALSASTPLQFWRVYNSAVTSAAGLGQRWTHTYAAAIQTESASASRIAIARPDGRTLYFSNTAGTWKGDADITDRLERLIAAGQPSGWRYSVAKDRSIETYNVEGQLVSIATAEGTLQTLTYTDGLLTQVQDQHGRTLQLAYDAEGRIISLTDPLGQQTTYTYTPAGLLASVQYPDTTQRQYHYNESAYINGGAVCSGKSSGFPTALTGITDQTTTRYATFTYDCQGRATSSSHAGGVDQVRLTFNTVNSTGTTVTDALNNQRTYGFKTIQGVARRTTASQPAGSGCAASTAQFDYDANGNITEKIDFNSTKTCSTFDLTRNLETARVEGLPAGENCTAAFAAASLGTSQRKISTEWHPHWPLVTKRAQPNQIITSVYNGQPDPTNGNTILNCAPATATLPNGQPLAVLCRQIEQPTLDSDGRKGFTAVTTGSPRITEWSYNAYGQRLTRRLPDNQFFTYAYAPATTATHTQGDLTAITAPAGLTTTYPRYDRAGRLLESRDPNNIPSLFTYDSLGRLTEQTVAGMSTRYTYTPVGQLNTIIEPDGMTYTHTYDAAQRLTGITDSLGNRITYTLDAAGNLTRETIADPANTLTRAQTRYYDALQRVERTVQGE